MKSRSSVVITLACLFFAGCQTYGPVVPGTIKGDIPYPEGVWLGPVPIDSYEHELRVAWQSPSKPKPEWKETLVERFFPDSWFPNQKQWEKLHVLIKEGDELWLFANSPFVVDGGTRYWGICIVRAGTIIGSVTTRSRD